MSESVLPIFSSRSFIVSGLTFRSLIHFEFILKHCRDMVELKKDLHMGFCLFVTQRNLNPTLPTREERLYHKGFTR